MYCAVLFIVSYRIVCACGALIVVPHVLGIDVERNVVVLVLLGEGQALEGIHTVCDDDADEADEYDEYDNDEYAFMMMA